MPVTLPSSFKTFFEIMKNVLFIYKYQNDHTAKYIIE